MQGQLGAVDFGEDLVDLGRLRAVAELPASHLAPVGDGLAPASGGFKLLVVVGTEFIRVEDARDSTTFYIMMQID